MSTGAGNKWLKRYEEYVYQFNQAVEHYELAQYRIANNSYSEASSRITASWYRLLLAEDALHQSPSTARQREAQRLWQQRGLLERTKANLAETLKLIDGRTYPIEAWKVEEAIRIIRSMIGLNMTDVATISERISNEHRTST